MNEPTTPQPFPWQLLYDELGGVATDLTRINEQIRHLRWQADQLEPHRAVLLRRQAALRQATEQYQEWARNQAAQESKGDS